jgi:hypothetical protein
VTLSLGVASLRFHFWQDFLGDPLPAKNCTYVHIKEVSNPQNPLQLAALARFRNTVLRRYGNRVRDGIDLHNHASLLHHCWLVVISTTVARVYHHDGVGKSSIRLSSFSR